jgi:hypothetical protein
MVSSIREFAPDGEVWGALAVVQPWWDFDVGLLGRQVSLLSVLDGTEVALWLPLMSVITLGTLAPRAWRWRRCSTSRRPPDIRREGATLSNDVVATGQRSSAVATGRPRVLVIGGKLTHVRKARELGLDVVHAQFPD